MGRTGTYIALDSVLERITEVDTINVFELLCQMREKRISMVQTSVSLSMEQIHFPMIQTSVSL